MLYEVIMIKVIFFDLDDTLLDFKKSEAGALKKALANAGITPSDKMVSRYSEINQSLWKLLELGKITRPEILSKRFEILFDEFGIAKSIDDVKDEYENLLGTGHYFVLHAPETLKLLYKDYDLYITSNGTASVQRGRIKSAGIEKYFKKIFVSQKLGFVKPQREFFEACFSQMPPCRKNEVIIVGDSVSSDILGGKNAGIHTCLYNPNNIKYTGTVKADIEISDLMQLPEIMQYYSFDTTANECYNN